MSTKKISELSKHDITEKVEPGFKGTFILYKNQPVEVQLLLLDGQNVSSHLFPISQSHVGFDFYLNRKNPQSINSLIVFIFALPNKVVLFYKKLTTLIEELALPLELINYIRQQKLISFLSPIKREIVKKLTGYLEFKDLTSFLVEKKLPIDLPSLIKNVLKETVFTEDQTFFSPESVFSIPLNISSIISFIFPIFSYVYIISLIHSEPVQTEIPKKNNPKNEKKQINPRSRFNYVAPLAQLDPPKSQPEPNKESTNELPKTPPSQPQVQTPVQIPSQPQVQTPVQIPSQPQIQTPIQVLSQPQAPTPPLTQPPVSKPSPEPAYIDPPSIVSGAIIVGTDENPIPQRLQYYTKSRKDYQPRESMDDDFEEEFNEAEREVGSSSYQRRSSRPYRRNQKPNSAGKKNQFVYRPNE